MTEPWEKTWSADQITNPDAPCWLCGEPIGPPPDPNLDGEADDLCERCRLQSAIRYAFEEYENLYTSDGGRLDQLFTLVERARKATKQ
jgi:hypothetical protein